MSIKSPVIDFYPREFGFDLNGERFESEGVILLPFIDKERLFVAMKEADQNEINLTDQERNRNQIGPILVFFNKKTNMLGFKCAQLEVKAKYVASFTAKDSIAG